MEREVNVKKAIAILDEAEQKVLSKLICEPAQFVRERLDEVIAYLQFVSDKDFD